MSHVRLVAALLVSAAIAGCATLQQFAALRDVQFAIDDVGSGRLAGIELSGMRSASDLGAVESARIGAAVAAGELPFEFVVDVRAQNPVDNRTTARMVRFAWTLLLNDRETIEGVIDREIVLPPGEPQIIPVRMQLDLVEFFDGNASDLLNLALRFAGGATDPTGVKLRAMPTIETPVGPIDYPTTITIVSDE